jgi:hypothetical protein
LHWKTTFIVKNIIWIENSLSLKKLLRLKFYFHWKNYSDWKTNFIQKIVYIEKQICWKNYLHWKIVSLKNYLHWKFVFIEKISSIEKKIIEKLLHIQNVALNYFFGIWCKLMYENYPFLLEKNYENDNNMGYLNKKIDIWNFYINNITKFMGHDLTIIVVRNLLFIGLYGKDMDVIQLYVLFEHQCRVHRLDTNVIWMFVLFGHECCVFICIVYTWKLCTSLSCLNNVRHSHVSNTNPWYNKFCTYLERTHEAYKFVMKLFIY